MRDDSDCFFLTEFRDVNVFFFQAEDGIRDLTVTGVQTCALPICGAGRSGELQDVVVGGCRVVFERAEAKQNPRSEERRVGKSVDFGGRRIMKKKTSS